MSSVFHHGGDGHTHPHWHRENTKGGLRLVVASCLRASVILWYSALNLSEDGDLIESQTAYCQQFLDV